MLDYLEPVEEEIIDHVRTLSLQHLGACIALHTLEGFPDLDNIQIALLGVPENRGSEQRERETNLMIIRKKLYSMYPGNWDCSVADLGNVILGDSFQDTYFALKEVTERLINKNVVLIVLGGSQDLTYPLYRAYDNSGQMVNLVSVDKKFDFGTSKLPMSMDSYLTKIVMEQPNNLHNFSNLGYQTYFASQEEIDLMRKMFFESHRLGVLSGNITIAEPVLRDADIVSLDLTSVQSAYTGNFYEFVPNGFTGKEICAISRYAGISEKLKVFGLFNQEGTLASEAVLQAQIVWYFIEGFACRYNENPNESLEHYTKYIIPLEDEPELIFYKSNHSQRWWMQIPLEIGVKNKINKLALFPCREDEYQEALTGNIPERWWNEQKKIHSAQ